MIKKNAVDQGPNFGKWEDPVSRFMYHDSMKNILKALPFEITELMTVGDFGGGNGLIKEFIPQALSIDSDPTKNPDIHADILHHDSKYDLAVVRYVLHYLTDQEVIALFDNINADKILLIQFVNDDLKAKYACSMNETKYFRTWSQLRSLLPQMSEIFYLKEYWVSPEFYRNRLGIETSVGHSETLIATVI